MSLSFLRGDIWNRGDPKRGALASWCACVGSCGVPAFAVGTMAIPKESAVDTNSETASSYAIGGAMTRARTTALLNFSQCVSACKDPRASFRFFADWATYILVHTRVCLGISVSAVYV